MSMVIDRPDTYPSLERAYQTAVSPQEKAQALLDLCSLHDKRGNHKQLLECAQEALTQARKARFRVGIANALQKEGRARYLMGEYESAIARLQAAYDFYKPLGNRSGIISTLCLLSRVHSYNNDPENARQTLLLAEQDNGRTALTVDTVRLYNAWSGFYISIGDPEKVIDYARKALALAEQVGDQFGIADACRSLGFVSLGFGDGTTGQKYCNRALAIAAELDHVLIEMQILTDLTNYWIDTGKLDQALNTVQRYWQRAEHMTADIARVQGKTLLCQVLLARNDYNTALVHAKDMTRLARRYGSPLLLTTTCALRATLHVARSEPDEALTWYERGLKAAKQTKSHPQIMVAYKGLAEVYEKKGNLQAAYECYRRYMEGHEQLLGFMRQKAIASAFVAVQLEQGERERERLQGRMQSLETVIAHKQQELTASALLVAEKDNLLSELQAELRQLLSMQPDESRQVLAEIIGRLGRNFGSLQAWEEFNRQFQVADPVFIKTLAERFRPLTPAELKICSLLRVNLSTKDIASLLSIQPSSVDIYRSAIRKKLGLSRGTNLTAFLTAL